MEAERPALFVSAILPARIDPIHIVQIALLRGRKPRCVGASAFPQSFQTKLNRRLTISH
jgi:hypothetical protein